LLDFLELHPDKGDLIAGTSGVRKLRWKSGKNDKGKSGGVRVLYHYSKGILVLLITIYSKSEKENISQQERNELKRSIPLLVSKYLEDL
jgi:mRNA-degrading endonuclease RelE of RelBE toxin-antitoxin system